MQAGLAPILPPADTLPVMRILWILAATCLLIECVLYLACATGGRTRRTSSSCLTASPTAAHAITGTRFAPGGAQKSRHGLSASPPRSSAQAPLQSQADSLMKAAAPLARRRRINLPTCLVDCGCIHPSLPGMRCERKQGLVRPAAGSGARHGGAIVICRAMPCQEVSV